MRCTQFDERLYLAIVEADQPSKAHVQADNDSQIVHIWQVTHANTSLHLGADLTHTVTDIVFFR